MTLPFSLEQGGISKINLLLLKGEGYASNQSIEDVSCHGGDGDSPILLSGKEILSTLPQLLLNFKGRNSLARILNKLFLLLLCLNYPWLLIFCLKLVWDLLPILALLLFAWLLLLLSLWDYLGLTLFLWDGMLLLSLGATLGSVPDFGNPSGSSSKPKFKKSKSPHSRTRLK